MRESRGSLSGATVGALALLLLALAPLAGAAPGSAVLRVEGPLDLAGTLTFEAARPALLLRDPGSPGFGELRFDVAAREVRLTYLRIEEVCVDALHPGVALVALPGDALRPSPLAPARDAVAAVRAAAPALADAPAGGALAPAATRGDDALAVAVALVAEFDARAAAPPTAPVPQEAAAFRCMEWRPAAVEEVVELANATLQVRATDPDYTVFVDLSDEPHAPEGPDEAPAPNGTATLAAPAATARVLPRGEDVHLLAGEDHRVWSMAPRAHLARGQLEAAAPAAAGRFLGDGEALAYRAEVRVAGVQEDGQLFEKVYRTGEHREQPLPAGPWKRVLEFVELDLAGADGTYASAGAVRLLGDAAAASLDGTLAAPDARGEAVVGNRTLVLEGGPLTLAGALTFALRPVDAEEDHEAAKAGAIDLAMEGDVTRVESAGVREDFPPLARTAAAVSVLAVLAGLLAYFWPALKFAVTPLYTRIAPDAVLLHGARERIYGLIRQEPGIHAHEVASRLGLGWGTTVYHLKLLERNSFVVARHEGRYKRFFVSGDQRLQHKEAVSMLRNATSRSIATLVAQQPGLIQKQLCQALGLSPSLASWHLQRLEAAGVVLAERLGRSVRYMPGPAWLELAALGPAPVAQPAATLAPAAAAAPQL